MKAVPAVKAVIKGRVQGVGYRYYILMQARNLGVTGYVKNRQDGSVEVYAQGDWQALKEFIDRVRNPPRPINVREISVQEAEAKPGLDGFRIVYE